MIKISGLDSLSRTFDDAQKAIEQLGEELHVSFNPHDPESIEQAIQQTESSIDDRLGAWADNPIVANLIEQTKEQYRQAILDRAAQARLEADTDGQ